MAAGLLVLEASSGLWRSPVAHLVRIERVRGSNPLSSTDRRKGLPPTGGGPFVVPIHDEGPAPVGSGPLPCVHGGAVGRGRIPCGGRSSGPEPRVSPAKRPSPGAGNAGLATTIPPLPRVWTGPSCRPWPEFGGGETSRKHTRVLGWPELRAAVCSRGARGVWWGQAGHVLLSRTVTGLGSDSGSLVRVWVVLVLYVECPHLRSGPQGP